MIRQDYLIRLIEEFSAALSLFLEKEKPESWEDDLRGLYEKYLGDYELLHNLSFDELMDYAEAEWEPDERLGRLGMVAELVYAEGVRKVGPMRAAVLEKAYLLLTFIERSGKTFSIANRQRLAELSREIGRS